MNLGWYLLAILLGTILGFGIVIVGFKIEAIIKNIIEKLDF